MNAVEIESAREALRAARGDRLARTSEETLDSLGRVFDLWQDPQSSFRVELETRLPEAAGFHPAMLREALDHALSDWTAPALRSFVETEGGHSPHPVTSVLLAGAIPMPTLLAIAFPLAVGSTALVKPASADPVSARLIADSICAVDPQLGQCVAIAPFSSDDPEAARAFFRSECVVATGSDETLEAVKSFVSPETHFVEHGHRVSIAALGESALRERAFAAHLASALALDIGRWDQLGCLSPIEIHCVEIERNELVAFAKLLASELEALESRMPRGAIPMENAAAIARERSDAEMRAALGREVDLFSSEGTQWTVVVEDGPAMRPTPLHRFIRIVPIASTKAMLDALSPLGPHLAAVALAGFGNDEASLREKFLGLGASRVVEPGTLQAPPLDWNRDNLHPLRSLMS